MIDLVDVIAVQIKPPHTRRVMERTRVLDAEIALSMWDPCQNSEYWLRHPERMSPFTPPDRDAT